MVRDMPDNVEIVREGYQRFNIGDYDGTLRLATEDISWDTRGVFPDGVLYQGREEVRDHWKDLFDRWDRFEVTPNEFIPVGDQIVFTAGTLQARAHRSEAPVESPWYVVWTVRDGQIRSMQNFVDREKAEQAAGMRAGSAEP